MKLIPTKSSKLPNIITFSQKTGFLRYCNPLGFKSISILINNEFKPVKFDYDETIPQCIYTFDNDTETVHLQLKAIKDTNKKYIFGSAYVDNQSFHKKVIAIVKFISKHIGCSFYLDDATDF